MNCSSAVMRVFEVIEPSLKGPVEAFDDAREALAARAPGLGPDTIFETVEALLANITPSSFKPVAEEFKPFASFTAVANMRFVRMQTKTVVLDPGADSHQGGLCFFAALAQHHEVVGIPHHPIAASRHQFIKRVPVDVGQQRADNCALRRALGRFPPFHSPHNFLTEPAAQQAKNAPITDALLDPLHQPLMRDRVEVALKVGVDHKRVAFLDELIHFAQRIPAAASRSKPVTHRPERRLEDRFKHKLHCRLNDAILDRRNPQRPRPAIALRYLYPPHRLRSVTALPQRRRKLLQVKLLLCLEPLDALPIHTRGTVIGPDPLPGRLQGRRRKHLVHQTVPTSSFDAVDQRRHHPLRPDRGFHPRILADFCALCSPRGHCRRFRLLRSGHCVSTFLPTFPRRVFAPHAFRRSARLRYYEGSDSCRTSPVRRQASPVHLSCLPSIQPPTTLRACTSRSLSPPCVQSVPCGSRLRHTSSRLAATPRRNGFVILQAARSHSGCSPPRLG